MHRLVMGLPIADSPDVHHIDGDGLNNQKSNLQVLARSDHLLIHRGAEKEQKTPASSPSPKPKGSKRFKLPAPCGEGGECRTRQRKGVRQLVASIDPEHAGAIYNDATDLGSRMLALAGYLCEQAQAELPTLERADREKACHAMFVAAMQKAVDYHRSDKGPIHSLPAWINRQLKERLCDVIGDDLLLELRRAASKSYGSNGSGATQDMTELAGQSAGGKD